jgi:hypothetical protein
MNKYICAKTLSHASVDEIFKVSLLGTSKEGEGRLLLRRYFFFEKACECTSDIGNGSNACLKEDTWLWNGTLACQHPSLYHIVRRKHMKIY